MRLSSIIIFSLTGYSSHNHVLILSSITVCIFFLYFSLCHMGTGHSDLGHHLGVPKSYHLSKLPLGYTIQPLRQLHNKVFRLKTVYEKLWTWDWTWNWKYNSIHQIGGGNRSVTWTFAEIRQYAADCHDFEGGHELKFMSNVHEDISVGENCVKS